jgi:hypothetical protein
LEAVKQDPEKKKSFEVIRKIRLTPASLYFSRKKILYKLTPVQKTIRWSIIFISSAAAVALMIMTRTFIPVNNSDESNERTALISSQNIVPDNNSQLPTVNNLTQNKTGEKTIDIPEKTRSNTITTIQKNTTDPPDLKSPVPAQKDSISVIPDNSVAVPEKIQIKTQIDLFGKRIDNDLVATNFTIPSPVFEEEQSKLSRFIAKTFREKILKENTVKDSPLKGYEIAEAGMTGLNKFFGWKMALDEKKDENGELKSVYFSSKLLKFNAPVKKPEPLQ